MSTPVTAVRSPQDMISDLRTAAYRLWNEKHDHPVRHARTMAAKLHTALDLLLDECAPMAENSDYLEQLTERLGEYGFVASLEFPGVVHVTDAFGTWTAELGTNAECWSMDLYTCQADHMASRDALAIQSPYVCDSVDRWSADLIAGWAAWRLRHWLATGNAEAEVRA